MLVPELQRRQNNSIYSQTQTNSFFAIPSMEVDKLS